MKPVMLPAVLGLAVFGLAPGIAMDGHASGDDIRLTITVTCDIHTDYLDEVITGIDLAAGTIDLGQHAQDCEAVTGYVKAAPPSSVVVAIPDGALFPDCQVTNDCFDPYTITIHEGTTISWHNNDTVPHTVTGMEPHPDGTFDSLMLAGEEFAYTFDTPGTYWYGCSVHPWARGVIVVEPEGGIDATPVSPEVPLHDSMALHQVAELLTQYREDGVDSFQEMTGLHPFREVAGLVVSLADQTVVAHNANPLFVGFHYGHLVESASIPADVILRVAQTQGVWISYPVPNGMGDITSHERGWVRIYDSHAFISSYTVTMRENVQGMVGEIIRLYAVGDITFDTISSFGMQSPEYPFVVDPGTMLVVADGYDSGRVGTMSEIVDAIPLEDGHGVWTEYVSYNPATGMEEPKRSWLVMHDGYLFGSGYHP